MSADLLLRLRVRHEPGALTRIVSILNPFSVTELSYAVEGGIAQATIRLDADSHVVARVRQRLERLVPVLEVSPHPDACGLLVQHCLVDDDEKDPALGLAPICV